MSPPVAIRSSAWQEPMVWLVIAGPLSVVLASMVTVMLCLRYPDPPLVTHAAAEDMPAIAARNHAATAGQKPEVRP